jgi:hypothetical protein
MLAADFGFWPVAAGFAVSGVTVVPLSNIDEEIAAVSKSQGVHQGWIYPPSVRQRDFMSGASKELPFPNRVFGLPKTHRIEVSADTPTGLGRFVVWCLGFCVGMRLTETEAGYLDTTPIVAGKLCDFLCHPKELDRAIEPAIRFYVENHRKGKEGIEIIETFLAALHTLWLSQNPRLLPFEELHYAYISLDSLWFVAAKMATLSPRATRHSERPQRLAEILCIQQPSWPHLSTQRNHTIHQGLFFWKTSRIFS